MISAVAFEKAFAGNETKKKKEKKIEYRRSGGSTDRKTTERNALNSHDGSRKIVKCQSLVGLSCPLELVDSAMLEDPLDEAYSTFQAGKRLNKDGTG